MNIIKKSILILTVLILAASCVTTDAGMDLITAAERREEIDSMVQNELVNYWFYQVPGMDEVLIGAENYLDDLYFDIYYPPGFDFRKPLPVLISAESRSIEGRMSSQGNSVRLEHSSFSLGQIMAASGIAVIIYEAREPVDDVEDLLKYLDKNQNRLKIDLDRTALWARTRNAFSALRTASLEDFREHITPRALILSSPHFHGPFDIPGDVPIMLSRSYTSGLMATEAEVFLNKAEKEGRKINLIEYKNGVPEFESHLDSPETRRIIKAYIDFLSAKLAN